MSRVTWSVYPAQALSAARLGRRTAAEAGHRLDAWQLEDGRPTAVCSCGLYIFVQRDGPDYAWGHGSLPVPNRGTLAHHRTAAEVQS